MYQALESDELDPLPALIEFIMMGTCFGGVTGKSGFSTSESSGIEDPCGHSSTRGKDSHWSDAEGAEDTAYKTTELLIYVPN